MRESWHHLTRIPSEIGMLKSLKYLDLYHVDKWNQSASLPDEVEALKVNGSLEMVFFGKSDKIPEELPGGMQEFGQEFYNTASRVFYDYARDGEDD